MESKVGSVLLAVRPDEFDRFDAFVLWRNKLSSMPFSCANLHTAPLMCSTTKTGASADARTSPSESDRCAKSCAISAEQVVVKGC